MSKVTIGYGPNAHRIVVSLCDYSGNWPAPYAAEGHTVILFDLKHDDDVTDTATVLWQIAQVENEVLRRQPDGPMPRVDTVLCAAPCTDFAVSGARWWKAKDEDGRTAGSLRVLDACMELIRVLDPRVWALENPVGRIPTLRPALGHPTFYFNPCEYALWSDDPAADAYTKRTGIWGTAVKPQASGVAPIMYERGGKRGSWMWANLGGKSERTKTLRSMTPQGFSRAFYAANKP